MANKDIKKIEYRATVSRDGFGGEYDDSNEAEQDAAETAYVQAAYNVMKRMFPNAKKVRIDIDFRPVGLGDSAVIICDGDEDKPDTDTSGEQGDIWDEMCGVTWDEARKQAGLI